MSDVGFKLYDQVQMKGLLFFLILSAGVGMAQSDGPVKLNNSFGQPPPVTKGPLTYSNSFYRPYFDVMIGFGLINDYGDPLVAPSLEARGGVYLIESMFIGTGLQVLSVDDYDAAIVLPLEFGIGSENNRWQFSSSIGYTYILWEYEDNAEGRTLAADVYWRPSISRKQLKFVLALGGTMYDFGDYYASRRRFCNSCNASEGPRFTLRLRAGIGF